jgi:hypothetical protein
VILRLFVNLHRVVFIHLGTGGTLESLAGSSFMGIGTCAGACVNIAHTHVRTFTQWSISVCSYRSTGSVGKGGDEGREGGWETIGCTSVDYQSALTTKRDHTGIFSNYIANHNIPSYIYILRLRLLAMRSVSPSHCNDLNGFLGHRLKPGAKKELTGRSTTIRNSRNRYPSE